MKLATIVMDVKDFEADLYGAHNMGVEIQSFPQHLLDENYEDTLREWQDKLVGFRGPIGLHGSSFDLNPGSTDQKILEVTRLRYLQSVEIAKEVKANYLVFHSQVNPLLSVERIRKMKRQNQVEFWLDFMDRYVPEDMTILLENEYDADYHDIKDMVDQVNKPNFGVCLDIGHALAYGNIPLEAWLEHLNHRIKYVHLHWNDGKKDQHDPPDEKALSILSQVMKQFDLSPVVTLEYRVKDLKKEVQRVGKFLR